MIDIGLPGGGRLKFPQTLNVDLSLKRDHGFAGFLDVRDDTGTGRGEIKVDGLSYRTSMRILASKKMTRRFGASVINGNFVTRGAYGIPYALKPEFRKANIQALSTGEWTEIELPLAPEHKEAPLQTSEVTVGPWTLSAQARPWKTTNAPVEFEMKLSGPSDRLLLVDYDWIHNGIMGYNPLLKCGISATPNQPFPFTANARLDRPLKGTICEVERIPLELVVDKNPKYNGQADLYLDGKCVYTGWRKNSHPPVTFGFKTFEYGGTFFGNATHPYLTEPIESNNPGWKAPLRVESLTDGQKIKAYGYRVIKSYSFSLDLKRPVTKELLALGTQPK